MSNTFIWTDLSTFDVKSCKQFYSELFGWQFTKTKDRSMDEAYHVAYQKNTPVAAVFTMPSYLQKINMPSFWMSYMQVKDIEAIVAKARRYENVIIEVEPTAFDANSKIALIRDPSGAGFTVYQGPNLDGRFSSGHGRLLWNVHHVDDKNKIETFYKDVFSWTLKSLSDNAYEVVHESGEVIAHVEELPDDLRGSKQYWMPIFAVTSLVDTKQKLADLGGAVVMDVDSTTTMCIDSQGGHFLVRQDDSNSQPDTETQNQTATSSFKWKAILGLVIVWLAVFLELN